MITMYGMSDEFGMVALETIESRYLDGRAVTQCSDQTATKIDTEVKNTIGACYADAEQMLRDNLQVLQEAAEFLIEKETITGAQFMEIFRRVRGEEPTEPAAVESITLDGEEPAGEAAESEASQDRRPDGTVL